MIQTSLIRKIWILKLVNIDSQQNDKAVYEFLNICSLYVD